MAKATGRKAAGKTEAKAKKRPAVTGAARATRAKASTAKIRKAVTAKKAVAKKPAAGRSVAKKVVVRKTTTAQPGAHPSKTKARVRKPAAAGKVRPRAAAVNKPAARSRRARAAVLEVSPAVIDTSAAAEVAARLVIGAAHPLPAGAFDTVFDPPPVFAVKRASSALRHVKEMLHKPVAEQLEGVFGPAPVAAESMRRFLKGDRGARTHSPRGSSSVHLGQSNVPHRSVG